MFSKHGETKLFHFQATETDPYETISLFQFSFVNLEIFLQFCSHSLQLVMLPTFISVLTLQSKINSLALCVLLC